MARGNLTPYTGLLHYEGGGVIRIASCLMVHAARWPWQEGYSWAGASYEAPLNRAGRNGAAARFGGGWKYRLGVSIGGTTVHLDLLFGMVSFWLETPAYRIRKAERQAERKREIDRILGRAA